MVDDLEVDTPDRDPRDLEGSRLGVTVCIQPEPPVTGIRFLGGGHRNHVAIIDSKIEYKNGYGFIRHGRIRCLLEREE